MGVYSFFEKSTLLGEYVLLNKEQWSMLGQILATTKQTYILMKSIESLEDIDNR